MDPNKLNGHGLLGVRPGSFNRLLPPNPRPFADASLDKLAAMMVIDDDELNDGADAEENLAVPAGYTYFGQFVDHDLTLDTTSSFADPSAAASNLRTPALDLDCVYGAGPADQPYLYEDDGATLRTGSTEGDPAKKDLLRVPRVKDAAGRIVAEGRAIIGDKRNDENSIVCQIQLAMILFHNAVVARLRSEGVAKGELFERARNEVTWTYQRVVLEDYLLRVVDTHTHDFFTQRRAALGDAAYDLYTPALRDRLPKEFVAAAYRFGHSMVRTGYRLNAETKRLVFKFGDDLAQDSLVGFQPLPAHHVIDDWGRFFTPGFGIPVRNGPPAEDDNPAVRLQWAYKMDPSLVLPLKQLPKAIGDGASLAALNLKRGNLPAYALATGQAFAAKLHEAPLGANELMVRRKTAAGFTFDSIAAADPRFLTETPLWFYILAEAQRPTLAVWREKGRDLVDEDFMSGPASVSRLGPVGGRILLEVFNGLVDADPRSFRNAAPAGWTPMIGPAISFWALLKFAGLAK